MARKIDYQDTPDPTFAVTLQRTWTVQVQCPTEQDAREVADDLAHERYADRKTRDWARRQLNRGTLTIVSVTNVTQQLDAVRDEERTRRVRRRVI